VKIVNQKLPETSPLICGKHCPRATMAGTPTYPTPVAQSAVQ
jgi:hypothetical protein